MPCAILMTVVRESLEGDIGDDWTYTVGVTVLNPTVVGSGDISVEEHTLSPGTTQEPPQPTRALSLPAGPCGREAKVQLKLVAREVDVLVDDTGDVGASVALACPGPDGPPCYVEQDIAVKVYEEPRVLGGEATLTVTVQLVASCGT